VERWLKTKLNTMKLMALSMTALTLSTSRNDGWMASCHAVNEMKLV